MDINDFNVRPEIVSIYDTMQINEDREIVLTLEVYKFKPRIELIKTLNRLIVPNAENGDSLQSVYDVGCVNRQGKFKELEESFNVLINELDENNCEVIAEVFSIVDLTSLVLQLMHDNVRVKYVTPLNYLLLKDSNFRYNYNPLILFKRYILEAIDRKATDIHFTVKHEYKEPTYYTMIRKDGLLLPLDLFSLNRSDFESMIQTVIEQKTSRDSVDLKSYFGVTASLDDVFGDGQVTLRISADKILDGLECVCRIQRKTTISLTIDQLGFPDYVEREFYKLCRKRTGITLITGAIRSGKNTTQFALANEMIKFPVKIKSFESPVEALMPFPQMDYGDNVEALASAVRLAKKQDLNIGLLNEIPTKDVAFAVKDLVNSSVHVITTMHIDRLWHIPYRLREYYGDQYKDVISQINMIINQKMFGVLCQNCKEVRLVGDLEDERKRDLLLSNGIKQYYITEGCSECINLESGTVGLIPGSNQPYVELLEFTPDLKSRLLSCNEPYEMEEILHKRCNELNHTLEYEMSKAIGEGKLSIDALDFIL